MAPVSRITYDVLVPKLLPTNGAKIQSAPASVTVPTATTTSATSVRAADLRTNYGVKAFRNSLANTDVVTSPFSSAKGALRPSLLASRMRVTS